MVTGTPAGIGFGVGTGAVAVGTTAVAVTGAGVTGVDVAGVDVADGTTEVPAAFGVATAVDVTVGVAAAVGSSVPTGAGLATDRGVAVGRGLPDVGGEAAVATGDSVAVDGIADGASVAGTVGERPSESGSAVEPQPANMTTTIVATST